MEQFSELKSALVGAWADAHADAISHGDGEAEGFLDSLHDQISGYADMSAEDADTLGIEISDADIAAWQTFVAHCAMEYLAWWDGTPIPTRAAANHAAASAKYQQGRRHAHHEFEGTYIDHMHIARMWDTAAWMWDTYDANMACACRMDATAHRKYAAMRG